MQARFLPTGRRRRTPCALFDAERFSRPVSTLSRELKSAHQRDVPEAGARATSSRPISHLRFQSRGKPVAAAERGTSCRIAQQGPTGPGSGSGNLPARAPQSARPQRRRHRPSSPPISLPSTSALHTPASSQCDARLRLRSSRPPHHVGRGAVEFRRRRTSHCRGHLLRQMIWPV